MSAASVEERVARLEQQMDALIRRPQRIENEPAPHEWVESVGMFRGDPVVKEMIDEAARARAEQRRQARDEAERCAR
jgi:hypothetical protein